MKPSVHLLSLGCAKNLVDSEVMLGTLLKAGHPLESRAEAADVVIVNTCGFVAGAKQESIDAILTAGQWRSSRPGQKLIAAGCLAQRHSKDLQRELPEVNAFIGINEVPRIHEIIAALFNTKATNGTAVSNGLPEPHAAAAITAPPSPSLAAFVSRKPTYLYNFSTPRYQLTPAHYAYLKVAEGCNHPCAFCAIPIMRGRHRSRSIEDIEAEARALLQRGVRELLLVSQDTTWYGRDLGIADGLSRLLPRLNALAGDFWIRILYTHPAHWDDRLMETIAACSKVCRYIDIPLQHIDDTMLLRMRRETSRAHIETLIGRLRRTLPGIALRTTFIVGFPGETEAAFATLQEFIQRTRFERLGVFEYSTEEGTVAGRMERRVSARIKKQRRRSLLSLQQRIAAELTAARIGQTLRVLVEQKGKSLTGRTEFDAPEIDGRVLLRGDGWQTGEFQAAKIVDSTTYDLVAEREFEVKS